MKEIILTKGYKAIVDDEDFDWLNSFNWYCHKGKYAAKKYNIRMHRLIMDCPKGKFIDHINHNGLDNRRENLRICTTSQNQMNTIKKNGYSSIFKGVCWNKARNKWRAYIKYQLKTINLGHFDNERHAALAYDLKAKELHGEFAKLNFS